MPGNAHQKGDNKFAALINATIYSHALNHIYMHKIKVLANTIAKILKIPSFDNHTNIL